ncbi:hypothetical protein LCGC14_2524750 [marine sediment metagenome]|uniref:10 kDa chaperonin n=1 Tax=marine sediment metagenome TaxID=412755 RepID=A0A0F9D6V7_9ZZZZ
MLKLPRNRVACVPIFDSSDTGVSGTEKESGNIIILDEYRERVDQGIVKYVGAGVTRERYGFSIGDMVIFSGYSGELVSIEGEGLFIILPARFVVAVIETEPTVVSGLWFKDSSTGNMFEATYEKAIELIAQALGETSVIKIAKDKPTLEDYKEVEEEDDE